MKKHILIVEDEALLYNRMRKVLEKENFFVDQYTSSVKEAIINIQKKRPDIVLLDIDLKGELTGIDLGKQLFEIYHIPFIYVTELDDDHTFYKGLSTHHEHFMVKTKPRLKVKELTRVIHTVLSKNEMNKPILKKGVIGLVGYLDEVKKLGENAVTRVPIKYQDIAFFTVKPFINENEEEEELQKNYLWFLTKNKEYFFMRKSLKELLQELPYNFVRINESYIVNIAPDMMDGRINGSRLSILKNELCIKETYKKEVNKRLDYFYS